MKRCPQCGRDYTDDTLSFCLDDGAGLLDGPASVDEPATAILPGAASTNESPTRTFEAEHAPADTADQPPPGITGSKRSWSRVVAITGGVVIIALVAAGVYWTYFRESGSQIGSIAVMPFTNEDGDPELEYLSDGMTESLINDLSKIPDLSVKARSTVFFYKGQKVSAKKLGEELNVQAVLFGRFAQRGEDVTISLELVSTQTQDVLWGGRFDRKINELVSLQSELAKEVSGEISSKLSGEEEEKVARSYTDNTEAYQAYLKGRFYWNQRTESGFKKGIEYFQQAIELDPNYALAWSGLADSYFLLPEYSSSPVTEFLPKARDAAAKAIELDPSLAESQTSMAYVEHTFEWKFKEAAERYRKAIELNPNYSNAYQWYSELLLQQRRYIEARREARKAIDLDPLSLIKLTNLGQAYFYAGEYSDAEDQFKKALEIKSEFPVANKQLARSLAVRGKVDEALLECDKALAVNRENFKFCKALVYAHAGDRKNAEKYKLEYSGLEGRQVFDLAMIRALLGDEAKALEGVGKLFEERSVFVLYLNAEPAFDKFRDLPQFIDLMKRVGIQGE